MLKISVLKYIILGISFLGAGIVAVGFLPGPESASNGVPYVEILIILMLLIISVSGFFARRYPAILLLPAFMFALLAVIEISFIVTGLTGPYKNAVPLWHTGLLFILLVCVPACLSVSCFVNWQHLSKELA